MLLGLLSILNEGNAIDSHRQRVVYVRWGHVLLSSWLDTSEQRTVVHQAAAVPMLQPLMAPPQQHYLPPPPAYLPPLETTRDLAGGVVSQGKGYQQITSWQVSTTSSRM